MNVEPKDISSAHQNPAQPGERRPDDDPQLPEQPNKTQQPHYDVVHVETGGSGVETCEHYGDGNKGSSLRGRRSSPVPVVADVEVTKEALRTGELLLQEEDNGRERLKRHRIEEAGRVWVPEIWRQEELLKDWIDCSAFDASLVPLGIMSARAALVEEGRRTNSQSTIVMNSRPCHGPSPSSVVIDMKVHSSNHLALYKQPSSIISSSSGNNSLSVILTSQTQSVSDKNLKEKEVIQMEINIKNRGK